MALFQNSVLAKYLRTQDQEKMNRAYEKYRQYFHDPIRQQNIREAKEEQFQEGFLRELLVNIFEYTINPDPGYNLTTEFKNEVGGKKADGALLKDSKAIGVVELKGTDTKELDKINEQAFNYKNNHTSCVYVITSNFEKLRFFIHNAVEHLEFNLFTLMPDEFKVLWLCLQKDNLFSGIPLKVKEESLLAEENVTKKLYKDYSAFKTALWQNLVLNHPDEDPLLLFKKSQKLIDRFLFIFFAEDSGLLPPNSISKIVIKWKEDRDWGEDRTLYDIFKQYFGFINSGRPARGDRAEIFAYNGGLFQEDAMLDNLKIEDKILLEHTEKLTAYDFQSEVDVNILGHIFENSLNEIESITAELEGKVVDRSKSRRKKDGVYYTPKYITKYIVENTIGILCDEKKLELNINGERFGQASKRSRKGLADLQTYRDWLLDLKICDPACGSGAFLNQALEFLIAEHRYLDELTAQYNRSPLVLSDIETEILEQNIYGVDINEESVEIARLSLWLRTARKGRKLTSLNDNIKCGNSLIDDPEVAGERAFNWQHEFPKVFEKGGFDVVIGNPPYVSAIELKKDLPSIQFKFLKKNYITAKGTVDLYIYFFERGIELMRNNGYLAYITPNRYLSASYGIGLREYILQNCEIKLLADYSDKRVFPDASTYPVITFLKNHSGSSYDTVSGKFDDLTKQFIGKEFPSSRLKIIENNILGFLLNDKLAITEKIINQSVSMKEVGKINATSTAQESDSYSSLINEYDGYKLINTGTIDPFISTWGYQSLTDKGKSFMRPYLPLRNDVISNNRYMLYLSSKIIISKIGLRCEAFYDRNGEYSSINTNCIHSFSNNFIPEYVLCWLNSKLYNYTFECLFDGLRMSGGYLLYSSPNIKSSYIKKADKDTQISFVPMAEKIEQTKMKLMDVTYSFSTLLRSKFNIDRLSIKLQNWHELEFKEFLSEIKKAKIHLGLSAEAEWMQYFNEQKQKVLEIKSEIDRVEAEIDRMVYELHRLTEEEIRIVEGN